MLCNYLKLTLSLHKKLAECDHPNVVTICSASKLIYTTVMWACINIMIVENACKSRGQDCRIALKLESMVKEIDCAEIIQIDNRSAEMSMFVCLIIYI